MLKKLSKSSKILFVSALIITPISIFLVANYFWVDNKDHSNSDDDDDGAFYEKLTFLSVQGNKIVDEKGEEIILRGIQFDFGSVRGDIEYDENDEELNNFFDRILDYIITEEDFVNIKSMGVNCLRFSLNTYKDFENNEDNFMKLDNMIEFAEKNNIYLIISMRQSPGGHNPSNHSGNENNSPFGELWGNYSYQLRIFDLWKKIAERYDNRAIVAGYDLLNEPMAPNEETLNQAYDNITRAIREVDSNHIIFLEGNNWTKKLEWINNPSDKNTALSIHFYEPGVYAVEGNGIYPSIILGQTFNKTTLRECLIERIEYAQTINRPLLVGEFGAMTRAGNYLDYDEDLIDIFEEQNLNWIYWNYKNIRGIPDTQAVYNTTTTNKFLELLSEIKNGKLISDFTENELNQALESLKTSNFDVKDDLKDLLIEAF